MDRLRGLVTNWLWFLRLAASGVVPAHWFLPELPPESSRAARTGPLTLEIVSHCWNYSHLLAYQLSSLVRFPPQRLQVTMTVFHSPEDARTVALLAWFQAIQVPGVRWNWQALPRERLFRRGIGRNLAARATQADWIWFTDCDVMFRAGCLDTLAKRLQGRRDALAYPREERRTALLADSDPLLSSGVAQPGIVDIDDGQFTVSELSRATGPMQITHGDVARACGYCETLRLYQSPSDRWCKAHEDRAFRWLLRTQGVPLDVPAVYRIRHVTKGRYTGHRWSNAFRTRLRALKEWLRVRRQRGVRG